MAVAAPLAVEGGGPMPALFTPRDGSLLVSWLAVQTPFSVQLPVAPSRGEAVQVACAAVGDAARVVAVAAAPQQPPCTPAKPACVAIPSDSTALNISFMAFSSANGSAAAAPIACTLFSTPLAQSALSGLPFPYYPIAAALSALRADAAPFSMPLLTAVLRESAGVSPGDFAVLGGDCDANIALPQLDVLVAACPRSALAGYAGNFSLLSPSFWRSWALVASCPPALEALAALTIRLRSPGPGAAGQLRGFSGSLSGSRHLLLFSSPLTPFPPAANLSIALGGAPCTLNWVTPHAASITTPQLAALCGNATGDCGMAPLTVTFLESARLPLPAAYPPLAPAADWAPALAAAAAQGATNGAAPDRSAEAPPLTTALSLIALPPPLLLASAVAVAAPGQGLRIVTSCIDPAFAPPEVCAVINGSQPLLNVSAGLSCVWGSGDACLPCPPGALCPGGALMLPLPGYWCPVQSSPPTDLYACSDPDATLRCPGYASASAGGAYNCGTGFRGQLCAACALGFFALRESCARCPAFSVSALLLPVVIFAAGLLAVGGAMAGVAYATLLHVTRARLCSGGGGPGAVRAAIEPVGPLMVWAWIAAQGLAALFVQAASLAPPALGPLFSAVGALQFKGIALDPACLAMPIPFFSFYAAAGFVALASAVAGAALCVLRGRAFSRRCHGPAHSALHLVLLAASLGYGAVTTQIASSLVCTAAAPMSLSAYLQIGNDGTAALAAGLPGLTRARLPLLLAASYNPLLAAANGLTPLLRSVVTVSVVAADPFQACGESSHRAVRPLAAVLTVVFTLGLPLLGLLSARSSTAAASKSSAILARSARARASAALAAAFFDPTLLPSTAWYPAAEKLLLALITGLTATTQARLPLQLFYAAQAAIAAAGLAAAALVCRARLFRPLHAWKQHVLILLHLLVSVAAITNAGVRAAGSGLGASARIGASALLLGLAAATLATLLLSWWRSLYRHMALNAATAAAAEAEAARLAAAMTLCHNPMLLHQPAQALQPMPRCVYQLCHLAPGDDAFWFNAATGDSQWELPVGADSACGWLYTHSVLGVGGAWRHSVTGAVESSARAVRKACHALECFTAAPAQVQALQGQPVLAAGAAVEEAGASEELAALQEVQAEAQAAQEEEVEAQEGEGEAQEGEREAREEELEAQQEMVEEQAAAPASRAVFAASLASSSYYSQWRAEIDTAEEQRVAARRRNPGIRDLQRQLQQQLRVAWDPLRAAPPGVSRKGSSVSQHPA